MTGKVIIKHIAKKPICETCSKLEQLKAKAKESGEMQYCMCTCSHVQVWPVKE